jgi:hypothetical protein
VIVYFDTSALLKRYVVEAGSEAVTALWKQTTESAASQILYAEVLASFARKRREQPGAADMLDEALQLFREDWMGLHRIDVDAEVNRFVDELLGRHPRASRLTQFFRYFMTTAILPLTRPASRSASALGTSLNVTQRSTAGCS